VGSFALSEGQGPEAILVDFATIQPEYSVAKQPNGFKNI
jgi:hypothetical protein